MEPKRHISSLKRSIHGGADHLELECLGLSEEGVKDFSVNVNPFGPAPLVVDALRDAPLGSYPDRKSISLKRAIAHKVGTESANILPGNGISELIWLLALAYLDERDCAFVIGPTYGEYADCARAMGAEVYYWSAHQEGDFTLHTGEITQLIEKMAPKIVFLCNPNNPTGIYLGYKDTLAIQESCKEGVFVLDEAYISFVDGAWSSLPLCDNGSTVIMRSLTKDHALAGIRLGYAIANETIIKALENVQPPWSVNIMAQKAGLVALDCEGYVKASLARIKEAKEYLIKGFSSLGFKVVPSSTHFFLVEVGDASSFRQKLLQKGFLVRDCTSFGLPTFIRVSPRGMEECRQLMDTVSALLDC